MLTASSSVASMRTVACLVDAIYVKGIKLCGNEKMDLEQRLERSSELNWWDINIHPKTVRLLFLGIMSKTQFEKRS